MTDITDEFMREMLGQSKTYTMVILRPGANYGGDNDATIWEHGRRNFALRAEGKLAIVVPITDDTDACGLGIFDAGADEVTGLMDSDPGVQAGVFTYEVHPFRGFPGDTLPA